MSLLIGSYLLIRPHDVASWPESVERAECDQAVAGADVRQRVVRPQFRPVEQLIPHRRQSPARTSAS
jgi:hypothetical protein